MAWSFSQLTAFNATGQVVWVPVLTYEGLYEASNFGRVRSIQRTHCAANRWGPMKRTLLGKVLANRSCDKDGYLQARLCKGGKAKTLRLATLVLEAFTGARPQAMEVCHIDHDRTNNSIVNLQWGTRQDNEDQKTASGRRPKNTRLKKEVVV